MNTRRITMLCCALALAASGTACSRGDAAMGEARAVTCLGCHGGPTRATVPNIPRISGQSRVYLAGQLRDYRDGRRSDPAMTPIASSLTDEEIDDIAAYFESLEYCED
jgi:cytochrome c553